LNGGRFGGFVVERDGPPVSFEIRFFIGKKKFIVRVDLKGFIPLHFLAERVRKP
jgi:hypothetical protein